MKRSGRGRGYNVLKLAVLAYLAGRDWTRPASVSVACRIHPLSNCYSYLARLHHWAILDRQMRGRGTLRYRLSRRGRQRLAYLQGHTGRNHAG